MGFSAEKCLLNILFIVWYNGYLGQIGLFLETILIPLMKTLRRRIVYFPTAVAWW